MAARRRGSAALVELLLVAATASAAVAAVEYPPPMYRPAATVPKKPRLVPNFTSGALPTYTNEVVYGSLPGFSNETDGRYFGWNLVGASRLGANHSYMTSRERADLDFSDSVTRHVDASFRAAQVSFLTVNNFEYGAERKHLSAQFIVVVGRDRRAAAIANVASFDGKFDVDITPYLDLSAGKVVVHDGGAFSDKVKWNLPLTALSNVGTPRRWAVVLNADGLPLVPAVAPEREQELLYPMCTPPEPLKKGPPGFYRSNLTSRGFHVRWVGAPTPYRALVSGEIFGSFGASAHVSVGGTGKDAPSLSWIGFGSWRADRDKLAFCLTRQANILSAVQRDVRTVVANATVRSAFMVLVDDWYWQRAPAQLVFAQLADERLAVVFNRLNEFQLPPTDPFFEPVFVWGGGSSCRFASFELRAARTVVVSTHNESHPLRGVPLKCSS